MALNLRSLSGVAFFAPSSDVLSKAMSATARCVGRDPGCTKECMTSKTR